MRLEERIKNYNVNVHSVQPINYLIKEFAFDHVMPILVSELQDKYKINFLRRIRGDGNCYYRSVYFGYFEMIISQGFDTLHSLNEL